MSDLSALHAEIVKNPADVSARLIMADYLEERSDPRGEFIRLQCTLDNMCQFDLHYGDLRKREAQLLAEYGEQWAQPPNPIRAKDIRRFRFRRGFVEEIAMELPSLNEHWATIAAWAPIRLVEIPRHVRFPRPSLVSLLSNHPMFNTIKALKLREAALTVKEIRDLAECEELERLQSLDIANTKGQAFDHSQRPQDPDISVLIQSKRLTGLRHLNLSIVRYSIIGSFRKTAFEKLRRLELNSCRMRDSGLIELSKSPLKQLRYLNLSTNSLTPASIKHLSSFSELEWLELSGNNIDTIGIRALVEAKLKNLRVLQLQANNIDDSTIDTILASGLIKQLIGLDIRHNSVTEKGLNALAQHPDASDNLRVFIENNQISDTLQASILRRFPKRFQRMGWPEHPRNYD